MRGWQLGRKGAVCLAKVRMEMEVGFEWWECTGLLLVVLGMVWDEHGVDGLGVLEKDKTGVLYGEASEGRRTIARAVTVVGCKGFCGHCVDSG
ncbi:unnamed protein product [Dovyalis caffra]|uniref:Uncharacterized protein n=1 Tax=Dovyalis caffra TaxID=77055 RepID=A0AAV1RJE2_9ROSI|nr:unnamed protein product [Dovyalis caffra]